MMRSRVATRFAASSTFFTQKRFDHTGGGTEVQCPGSGVSCRSAGPQFPTRAAGTPPPLLPMTGILSSYGDGKLSLSPLALDIAAFFGATADAALLIRHGADVNATRDRPLPQTPLQVAVQSGHAETVKLLIDSGADFHTKMKLHSTPLHLAVAGGHAAVVKLLLEHGADPTTVNDFGCSPLHSAAHGRDAIAKLLIDCGANVNVRMTNDNHRGWTPLHKAARGGLPSTIKLFVDSGADIHARDASSRTPLHIAAQYDYSLDNARALIDHGADVNAVCESNRTPLHHTNEKVARVLLAAGADASAKAEDARTPLHDAVVRGDATLAELFAQSGVDVNAVDKESITPLHLAVEQGHARIIDVLLAHGADVNARGKNDRTPLHVAVGKGQYAVAKVLLENGADANIVAGGQTPLNLAVRRKKLAKLLIRHGARVDTTP